MGRVIIAEKPSVAEAIAQSIDPKAKKTQTHWVCASGDNITWAVGQLIGLSEPESYNPAWKTWAAKNLPIIPPKYTWEPKDAAANQRLEEIRQVIADANPSSIVNACDAAREGEYIFRLIWAHLQLEGKYPMERLWLTSMTPKGINKALSSIKPGDAYRNLALAAAARSKADWVVGLNGTRAATNALNPGGAKETWSVGRVQTPSLAIIFNHDEERKSFVSKPKPLTTVTVATKSGKNMALQSPTPLEAAALINTALTVSSTVETVEVNPPPLFDLTTLQQEMNRTHGWTAAKTLAVAQKLYDKEKVLTYPRSESTALPEDYAPEVQKVLGQLKTQGVLPANTPLQATSPNAAQVFDNSKVTDHFALIPTETPLTSTDPDMNLLYAAVSKRLAANFCPPETVEVTTFTATLPDGTKLEGKQSRTLDPGWKMLHGKSAQKPLKAPSSFPATCADVTQDPYETQPPPPLQEADLLEKMCPNDKPYKLGTAATRANVIEGLKTKGYVNVNDDGSLEMSSKGNKLISSLKKFKLEALSSPQLTGEWEAKLQGIEAGTVSAPQFSSDVNTFARDIVAKLLPSMDR